MFEQKYCYEFQTTVMLTLWWMIGESFLELISPLQVKPYLGKFWEVTTLLKSMKKKLAWALAVIQFYAYALCISIE